MTTRTFKTNATYQRHRIANAPDSLIAQISKTLVAYQESEGTYMESAIRDALTDLRHLCDVHKLDFGAIDCNAYQGYLEELDYHKEAVNA